MIEKNQQLKMVENSYGTLNNKMLNSEDKVEMQDKKIRWIKNTLITGANHRALKG